MTREVKNVRHYTWATCATSRPFDEQDDVKLNLQLPRWDYINNSSYIEIDPKEWETLKQQRAEFLNNRKEF